LRTLEITNGLNTQYWTIDMDTQRIVTEAPPAPPAPGGCRPGGRGDFECRARQCVTRCYPPPPAPAPGPTVIVAPGGCRTWDRGELEHRIRCLVRENFGHCVCHVRVDADLACRKVRVQVETREYHVIRQVGNLLASRPELAGLTIYVERD
jgi:hypothetical protein